MDTATLNTGLPFRIVEQGAIFPDRQKPDIRVTFLAEGIGEFEQGQTSILKAQADVKAVRGRHPGRPAFKSAGKDPGRPFTKKPDSKVERVRAVVAQVAARN